jgi:hypothetical protein
LWEEADMAGSERIYRRTEAGDRAWVSRDPGLRAEHRTVLGLIGSPMHSDAVRKALRRSAEAAVSQWLAELEALKLVESSESAPEHDLDFTGSFNFQQLTARKEPPVD